MTARYEVVWQDRYEPYNGVIKNVETIEEARGIAQHIEAVGPYRAEIVDKQNGHVEGP